MFKVSSYDFDLPEELIAQTPRPRRSDARLMRIDRSRGSISHHRVHELPRLLDPEDLLVLNNTRVFPARLFARGDRPIEILLLRRSRGELEWEVLARPGRRLKTGSRLVFQEDELEATVLEGGQGPIRKLRFETAGDFWEAVEKAGVIPLPPYIRRPAGETDRQRYQTVFSEVRGSVAAPTAGLHFEPDLLRRIRHCFVTLHVGYGTFKPVTADDLREHRVDPEVFQVSRQTATLLQQQKEEGKRVVAVGTTTTRVLEHWARSALAHGELLGETNLYIYPGFDFRLVDRLMTNFHLPKSSLMFLVSAFAGPELLLKAYSEAIAHRYHFYSYGDAMLIV